MSDRLDFPADLTPCSWCQRDYPTDWMTLLEKTVRPIRLCPGCYFCWRHGPIHDAELYQS